MKMILISLLFIILIMSNPIFAFDALIDTLDSKKQSLLQKNNKYGWNSALEWKQARGQFKTELKIYNIYTKKKQSHLLNCLKSLVAPGWGHFSARSYTKGQILLGVQILLAGSSFYFYDKSMDMYNKYNNADQIDDIHQYYTDANSSYRTSQIFFGLCALLWAYTILDTIQTTENYNRNLWEKLIFEYKNTDILLTTKGLTINF